MVEDLGPLFFLSADVFLLQPQLQEELERNGEPRECSTLQHFE